MPLTAIETVFQTFELVYFQVYCRFIRYNYECVENEFLGGCSLRTWMRLPSSTSRSRSSASIFELDKSSTPSADPFAQVVGTITYHAQYRSMP